MAHFFIFLPAVESEIKINGQEIKTYILKMNSRSLISLIAFMIALALSSCAIVGGIFKAGMAFGIFIVVAIIILIAVVVIRANKK